MNNYDLALIEFMFENVKDARNITTEEFKKIDFIYRILKYEEFEYIRNCVIARQKQNGIIKVGNGECRVRF